jgi:phospholipase/carboxylesterase
MDEPEIIEIGGTATAAVIWLHGLGADGNDFVPIVPQLDLPKSVNVRFIFPHAPMQAVTINAGYVMRAWYDIKDIDLQLEEDAQGIKASQDGIIQLIETQINLGITPNRIVLAGFSQGGAIALYCGLRYPKSLAGILALSTYLPLAQTISDEKTVENHATPIMMAHGRDDPTVPFQAGIKTRDLLTELGYQPTWHEYAMQHEVCAQEISDIGKWIAEVL